VDHHRGGPEKVDLLYRGGRPDKRITISGSPHHHRVIIEDIIRVADIKSTMATQDEVLSILDEVSQVRLWMRYISRYVVLSLQNVPLIYFKNV
jgi:hypothetical protein